MKGVAKMCLIETRLCLNKTIYIITARVNVGEVALKSLREVATRGMRGAHSLATERHIDEVIVTTESAIFHVLGLALQFILDALSIRCVADEWEYRANAFDK